MSKTKTRYIRRLVAAFALLGAALAREQHARAITNLPPNTLFTNFTLGNAPGSEGVIYTPPAAIDYPNRMAPTLRRISYMVPAGFNAQRTPVVTGFQYGLIIALHGGGSDGRAFATEFFSNMLGRGYAFVFPWGVTWPGATGNHFQDIGPGGVNCDGGAAGSRSNVNVTGVDCLEDLKFLQYLIDGLVRSNPQIDPTKIFVAGWSNGSGLTLTSLCWGSQFAVGAVAYGISGYAAVGKGLGGVRQELGCGNATIAANSYPAAFNDKTVGFSGTPPAPYGLDVGGGVVPLHFHFGLLDDHVFCQAYDPSGNCIAGMGPDDPMLDPSIDDASETMQYFRSKHGLSASFTLTSIPDGDSDGIWAQTIRGHHTTAGTSVFSWAPPAGSETKIKVVRVTGGGHPPSSIGGMAPNQCHDFDWSEMITEYFEDEAGLLEGPY